MGQAGMLYREIRFVIGAELTECYVLIDATGDAPLGVQGWHHKTFPASKSVQNIMEMWADGKIEEPVMWPQDAP